jgi:hypothetical protein
MYVPLRLSVNSTYRPDGMFTCFARVLAGGWCLRRWWHGDLLIVHNHWQHSFSCACSRAKFPNVLVGFSLVFRACACRVAVSQSWEAQWPSHCVPSVGSQLHMCAIISKVPIALMETSMETHMFRVLCLQGDVTAGLVRCAPRRAHVRSKVPIALLDTHMFRVLCLLQGGGVYVEGGTVAISSCTINGNTAGYVCAHVQKFPSP